MHDYSPGPAVLYWRKEDAMQRLILLAAALGAVYAATAQDHMTGMFRLSMTTAEISGEQTAQALSHILPPDEPLEWQVFVPHDFDSSRPPGVFVFLDANGWGGIPDAWMPVFSRRNLIWVGPRRTQRVNSAQQQALITIMSLRAIEARYPVDLNRLYIGSTGGHASTSVHAQLMANEFRGAVYIRGAAIWQDLEEERLALLQRKRHVFITGTNDEAKGEVRRIYEKYRSLGIENTKLIFAMRRLGAMPEPEQIEEALSFLDGY